MPCAKCSGASSSPRGARCAHCERCDRRSRAARSNATLLRDFDFRRPLLDLQAYAVKGPSDAGAGPPNLGVYTHRGEYDEPEVTPARAETALEQHRRQAMEGAGETTCRRLVPGYRFTLDADTPPSLAREYVVTHVEHAGHTPELSPEGARPYHARFRCVPADTAYRPKRPKPQLRQVLESATVVGPAGEEIYTDAIGRIKVQFHWDLYGRRDESSSCWIRVVQGWAGATWGIQFIPRIGAEAPTGGRASAGLCVGLATVSMNAPEETGRSGAYPDGTCTRWRRAA